MMQKRETFKKGVSAQDGARKREDNIVSARKNKREERLNQKRRTQVGKDVSDRLNGSHGIPIAELQQAVQQVMKTSCSNAQLEGATFIQRLLSREKDPPIDVVARVPGLIQRFVQLLDDDSAPKLQFEACWVLTNVASGTSEHTQAVVNAGAIAKLVRLLDSTNSDVREQSVWALGNIAGDSIQTRDVVIAAGSLPPLMRMLAEPAAARTQSPSVSLARQAVWAISNMCRGAALPPNNALQPLYPVLGALVQSDTDGEVLTDACWALSYLSDGPNEWVQAVLDTNITRRLVDLLGGERAVALVPALRIIGNIVTGTDEQTQIAINCGALQQLRKLLSHSQVHKPAIVKEACWALSNVTAGTKEQVDAVIASGSVQELIRLLDEGCGDVKREALWAISNAASSSESTQCAHLVQLGCLSPMVTLLQSVDARVVMVALEGLKAILAAGVGGVDADMAHNGLGGYDADSNPYALEVEKAGGLDAIENLQNHTSSDVQERAVHILTTFFEVLPEDENVEPAVGAGGNFVFSQTDSQQAMAVNFSGI